MCRYNIELFIKLLFDNATSHFKQLSAIFLIERVFFFFTCSSYQYSDLVNLQDYQHTVLLIKMKPHFQFGNNYLFFSFKSIFYQREHIFLWVKNILPKEMTQELVCVCTFQSVKYAYNDEVDVVMRSQMPERMFTHLFDFSNET